MKVGVGKEKLSVDAEEDGEEEVISVRQKVADAHPSHRRASNAMPYNIILHDHVLPIEC